MKTMDKMTPDQQEQVVEFWNSLGRVLAEVFDWFGRMLGKLVDLIQQGYKLVKETTEQLLKSLVAWLKKAFKSDDCTTSNSLPV